jgi:hypothetical protein
MTPEARVRNKVVKFAAERGVLHIRMSFRPGVARGWPDDLFLIPGGRPLFIEFKRPGARPTPLQLFRLETLNALGYDAGWCDSADEACRRIASAVGAAALHGASS